MGIDVLAWYSSFHSHEERWGIYVPLSSVPIMDHLYLSDLALSRSERWQLAWDILIAHETVHFAVDYAVAWFELMYHVAIKRAFADRMNADLGNALLRAQSSYLEIEETLANGNVLREIAARIDPDAGNALRNFIRQQPPGYNDGELAESDDGFTATTTETLRSYLAVWSSGWNIDLGNPALDLTRLLPLGDDAHATCPVWVINDLESSGLPTDAVKQIFCIQSLEETKGFRKDLQQLHPDGRRAWERLKNGLQSGIPNGCRLKKWKPEGIWSVRLNDNIRAHLQQPEDVGRPWLAIEIGGHTKMGHDSDGR